jgi:hypothetical protein
MPPQQRKVLKALLLVLASAFLVFATISAHPILLAVISGRTHPLERVPSIVLVSGVPDPDAVCLRDTIGVPPGTDAGLLIVRVTLKAGDPPRFIIVNPFNKTAGIPSCEAAACIDNVAGQFFRTLTTSFQPYDIEHYPYRVDIEVSPRQIRLSAGFDLEVRFDRPLI